MILFKTLSWMNFLSTGQQPTVIRLDKSPTTLILGANGSGKSTMLDALTYGLFKKPFRKIKKDQIYNTINGGDCVVEIEFSIGTHEYKVRRGLKPDFLEVYVDGDKRKQEAAKKDDQAFLEEDILKINCDAFKQVVILGNADYTPFMQLSTPKRREFIEQILDIGVFSLMNELLSTRNKNLKNSLDTNARDIVVVMEQIALVQGFIDKLKAEAKKASDDTQRQIDEQNTMIDGLMPEIETLTTKLNEENDALSTKTTALNEELQTAIDIWNSRIAETSSLENSVRKAKTMRADFQSVIKAAQSKIDFYEENASCKTCGQDIHTDHRDKIVTEAQSRITESRKKIALLDTKMVEWDTHITDITANNETIQATVRKLTSETQTSIRKLTTQMQVSIRALTAELQTKQSSVSAARQFIKKLQVDMKKTPGNVEEQERKLSSLTAKFTRLEREKDEAVQTKHFYEVASVLLKDTGIKAAIIKQYLPTINRQVNKFLADLDFFLSFHLDESFNETFKSRHRDALSYYSFSEGEKLMIDLGLLFTWRDIARMKNSCATNLLMLDEVIDSSLDSNGTDFFIRMLNQLGAASNVFVISHKNDAALDKFQDVIRFEKTKNFSHLVEQV